MKVSFFYMADVRDGVATPICSILTSAPKQSKSQQSKQIKWSFLSEKETRNGWQCSVSKFDEVTLVKFIASSYSLGCRPSICKRCNLTTVTKLSANSCYLYIDIGSFYRSRCFSPSPPIFFRSRSLCVVVFLNFFFYFFVFHREIVAEVFHPRLSFNYFELSFNKVSWNVNWVHFCNL